MVGAFVPRKLAHMFPSSTTITSRLLNICQHSTVCVFLCAWEVWEMHFKLSTLITSSGEERRKEDEALVLSTYETTWPLWLETLRQTKREHVQFRLLLFWQSPQVVPHLQGPSLGISRNPVLCHHANRPSLSFSQCSALSWGQREACVGPAASSKST